MSTIKKRSEIDQKYKWAIEDLYVSDEAWEKDYDLLKTMAEKVNDYKGKLDKSADNLLGFLKLYDDVSLKADNIYNYAARKFDEDTTNSTYQSISGKMSSLLVYIQGCFSFAQPEIINIDDEKLKEFYNEKEELRLYEKYINELKRKKEHTLSESEEKLLASANSMAKIPEDVMSMFRNADIQYPDVIGEDGKPSKLTASTYISFLESENREVRKDAFMKLYNTLGQFKNTAAASYYGQIKQLMFFANAKKYNSTLEKALDENNVPVSVYKNLINAVHENMDYMHKYVRLRKKLLNVDKLHMYDLYTPVVPAAAKKISFEEAKKTVYEAVAPLGKEYQSILKQGFDNRWIDVYENEGKRSGAYSSGAQVHPYVLLNYTDSLDSEFTLAHEMGHAIHSYLSNRTQPIIYSDYKIFVAEVASTCNEALLMEYLLKNTTDKLERATLINHFLEQFRGTIYRQTMFAEFEMLTNEMAEQGKPLTAEALSELYYNLNVQYFGKDIVVDKEIALEWTRIPHMYYNFYVYQYATGYSAAIALSRKILDEGQSAVDNYLKFLSGGCSASPIELLKIAGVDMNSVEPIKQALSVFGRLIDELDELLS